eukprot:CAMPEP_0119036306 /NCGR_PEP_ID=MMETSP1177-20130426/3939_1 /TAXON_ID=2985 /ORGANISM="Ochromonas sp, Strain CCMP1899" /LENGTH=327 /DNA_ID=CAMNT_0006995977 /DNA_START=92 /DNA_END=1075 /DNA_ORIENTATION=-
MLCRVIRCCTLPGKVKGTYNSKLFMSSVKKQTPVGDYKQLEICDIDDIKRKVCYVDIGSDTVNVPLVLLCGTAQTVNTFSPHLRQISKTRRLIIIELRCQGMTELLSEYGTIEQHVKDFCLIMSGLGLSSIHLAGFSFGGRVSLAVAANHPLLVTRLSVTGVPLERPALGELILQSWTEGLKEGHLRNTAWSCILNGYSADFITKYRDRLSVFVDMVVAANDVKKLSDLMVHSHVDANDETYGVPACAERIYIPTQVIGASEDRIAGFESVKQLSQKIKNSKYFEIKSGHLAPFESPAEWRKLVLDFMAIDSASDQSSNTAVTDGDR